MGLLGVTSAWEYKQERIWAEDYEATLNELGADGWEVTQSRFHPGLKLFRHPFGQVIYAPRTSWYTVLLKRRKLSKSGGGDGGPYPIWEEIDDP